MNISSGSVFGPVQPQNMPDFSALNDKNFASFSPSDFGGGTQSISYGNDAMSGTDFNSLTNIPGLSGSDGNMNDMQMQMMAQMLGAGIQALMQMLSILQQLFAGQQQESSSSGTGTGNGSGAGWPAASEENASAQQPLTTPANAVEQPAVATPQQPVTAQSNATQTTPAQGSVETPTSGVSTTQGSSGLHLPEPLKRYEQDIMHAAKETGIQPEILAAQIWQESRGKADAVTTNGGNGLSDSGVMQVNSNTFADLQSKNPNLLGPNASPSNSSDSIMAGALYMKEQKEAFGGDMGAALRAYNSGPGNVNVNDLTDISKTGTGDATYVDKVLNFAKIISSGNGTLPA